MMSIQYLYNELVDLGLDVINSIPLTLILFSMLGLIVVKRSLINVIIALEILLLASSFQAIIASISHDDVVGTIFANFYTINCSRGICNWTCFIYCIF